MSLSILSRAVLLLAVVYSLATAAVSQSDERAATIGSADAPVKIDLYFSYACPHCLELLSETQDEIDEAVTSEDLQIRYLEIPRFYARSTKDYETNKASADQRSMYVSLIMQCFIQGGSPDGFNAAQKALPGLLKSAVGSDRTLPNEDAPSHQEDWQYWVWADQLQDLTPPILQPLINVAGVDVRACDRNAVSEVFNARFQSLRNLDRRTVPELVINGELAPAAGEAHFARLKEILQNADIIADILKADLNLQTMRFTEPQIFSGQRIEDINRDLKDIKILLGGNSHYLSFGPDRTLIEEGWSELQSFSAAPLLDVLFFRENVSVIAEIHTAPVFGADRLIVLTDLFGNTLRVILSSDRITSIAYQGVGEDGFKMAMGPLERRIK